MRLSAQAAFSITTPRRILVVATKDWPHVARLCLELVHAGLDVRGVAPRRHGLHRTKVIETSLLGARRSRALATISEAIRQFDPDLVIPGDESAIDYLHVLHGESSTGQGAAEPGVAKLIEDSLGNPASFGFAQKKSRLIQLAREEGLQFPSTVVVRDAAHLRTLLAAARFPIVVKIDAGAGGEGVRIAGNAGDAERAFAELKFRSGRLMALAHAVDRLDLAPLSRLRRPDPTITLQEFIEGPPANRAVYCHKGTVLAGLSVEALETLTANGGASVVRVIDAPEMASTAARIVKRLGLSGFAGFDFVIDAKTRRPYLLELNARPTPICHIALDKHSDLIGALWADSRRKIPNVGGSTIALYPTEIWRNRYSGYQWSAYHDVPSFAPEFVAAYSRRPRSDDPGGWLRGLANLAKGQLRPRGAN